ncbi:hypothetical protein [Acetobacter fallax]|uniref:Uncharacterized protein n=1 Tax=Acetobacter fallax TaxID=1737473 RepID=A0ABX0K9B2_9PROT|nr:hypothetical protein [Acetobacter fallax]NHO32974.1 hypothetical protein [Acetobacter fallax]NHO36657.1 hypothetical protein [Acetobacter fallax]
MTAALSKLMKHPVKVFRNEPFQAPGDAERAKVVAGRLYYRAVTGARRPT